MKYIGIIITLTITIGSLIYGYGQLNQKTEIVIEDVEKVEIKVEKHGEQIIRMQELDVRQTMLIERLEEKL